MATASSSTAKTLEDIQSVYTSVGPPSSRGRRGSVGAVSTVTFPFPKRVEEVDIGKGKTKVVQGDLSKAEVSMEFRKLAGQVRGFEAKQALQSELSAVERKAFENKLGRKLNTMGANLTNIAKLASTPQRPQPQTGGRAVERFIVNRTGQEFARLPPQLGSAVPVAVPVNPDVFRGRNIQWDFTHPMPRMLYLDEAQQRERQPVLSSMYEFYKDNVTQMNFGNNSIPLYEDCPVPRPAESKAVPFGAGFLGGGLCDPAGVVLKNTVMGMPPFTTFDRNLSKKTGVQY